MVESSSSESDLRSDDRGAPHAVADVIAHYAWCNAIMVYRRDSTVHALGRAFREAFAKPQEDGTVAFETKIPVEELRTVEPDKVIDVQDWKALCRIVQDVIRSSVGVHFIYHDVRTNSKKYAHSSRYLCAARASTRQAEQNRRRANNKIVRYECRGSLTCSILHGWRVMSIAVKHRSHDVVGVAKVPPLKGDPDGADAGIDSEEDLLWPDGAESDSIGKTTMEDSPAEAQRPAASRMYTRSRASTYPHQKRRSISTHEDDDFQMRRKRVRTDFSSYTTSERSSRRASMTSGLAQPLGYATASPADISRAPLETAKTEDMSHFLYTPLAAAPSTLPTSRIAPPLMATTNGLRMDFSEAIAPDLEFPAAPRIPSPHMASPLPYTQPFISPGPAIFERPLSSMSGFAAQDDEPNPQQEAEQVLSAVIECIRNGRGLEHLEDLLSSARRLLDAARQSEESDRQLMARHLDATGPAPPSSMLDERFEEQHMHASDPLHLSLGGFGLSADSWRALRLMQ